MENNYNQQTNTPNQMSPGEHDPQVQEQHSEEKTKMGPLMGIVIIIAILVFGGLYFWGARINNTEIEEENIPQILGDDGSSLLPIDSNTAADTPEDIEADFDTTDLDALDAGLDADLSAIELELQ